MRFEWITFDCYGTLIDWEGGITNCLTQIFKQKRTQVNVNDVLRVREDIDFELVQGDYKPYKDILQISLSEAFKQFKIPYADGDGRRLVDSVGTWQPFQETRSALQRLGKKAKLAIISNIDKDIIEKTKATIGVPFSLTVTAEEAGAYKPTLRPFEIALRKLGCGPTAVLHVSSGFRYDIPPAHRIGFTTAWVNRKSDQAPIGLRADHEFKSLSELADFLEQDGPTKP
jgi:2-haloalkanoic acid dehalogenase type II